MLNQPLDFTRYVYQSHDYTCDECGCDAKELFEILDSYYCAECSPPCDECGADKENPALSNCDNCEMEIAA